MLLQVLIILTGNYNFFNLLTITLCIPLLDDEVFFGARKRPGQSALCVAGVWKQPLSIRPMLKLFHWKHWVH